MFNELEQECQTVPKYYGDAYLRRERGLRLGDDGGKWIGGRSNPRRKRLKCWIRSRQMGSFKISSAILSQLRHITVHLLNIQERKRQPFIHSNHPYNFWLTIPDQKLTCSQVFWNSTTVSRLKKLWLRAKQSHQQYLIKRFNFNLGFSGSHFSTLDVWEGYAKLANLFQI